MCTEVRLARVVRPRHRHRTHVGGGLANIMTVNMTGFEAEGLTVSHSNPDTMLLRALDQALRTSPLALEAAA